MKIQGQGLKPAGKTPTQPALARPQQQMGSSLSSPAPRHPAQMQVRLRQSLPHWGSAGLGQGARGLDNDELKAVPMEGHVSGV